MLLFGARRALLTGPHPPGSSRLCRLRGFHHWFTRRCTVLPCLPDPGRLAVPTRPVVVRAAPTLPGASQAGLPSASAGLLRQPSGGSFHPTRSPSASWRTTFIGMEVKVPVPRSGQYTYYPGTSEVPERSAANVHGVSYKVLAEVELTPDAEGVIFAQGSRFGGHALIVRDRQLSYIYNFLGIPPEKVV